jgi:MFS family permease
VEVMGAVQLMVVLELAVVSIALPSARHALHFAAVDRQWVVTAYALCFGSLPLLGGRLVHGLARSARSADSSSEAETVRLLTGGAAPPHLIGSGASCRPPCVNLCTRR